MADGIWNTQYNSTYIYIYALYNVSILDIFLHYLWEVIQFLRFKSFCCRLEYQGLQFFQNHLHFSRPSKDVCFWSGQTLGRTLHQGLGKHACGFMKLEKWDWIIESTGSRWASQYFKMQNEDLYNQQQSTDFGAWAYHPTFIKETFNLEGGDIRSKALTWSLTNAILRWLPTLHNFGSSGMEHLGPVFLNLFQRFSSLNSLIERRLFDTLRCQVVTILVSEMTGHVGPGWLVINWETS